MAAADDTTAEPVAVQEPLGSRTSLFRALHEISGTAARILDPAELVKVVAARSAELLRADAVVLYLWDEAAGMLVQLYSSDARTAVSDPPVAAGSGAAGLALTRREPVSVADYPSWQHAQPWAVERGLRAVEAVPLLVGDQAIGVLVARFYAPRQLTPEDAHTLSILAAQVAPALEAARLYARSRWEHERERALREVTQALAMDLDERKVLDLTVQHAASLLTAPYARVWLLERDGGLSCAAAQGHLGERGFGQPHSPDTVSGKASRQVIVNLADVASDPAWRDPQFCARAGLRAYLGAGIWRAGASLGALEVMRPAGSPFTAAEEELLISLANAVAVAVSNARLHAGAEELTRQAQLRARAEEQAGQRRLAFLVEASQILASSLEYETTLQSIARLVVPTIADFCLVDMLDGDGTVRRVASAHPDPAADEWLRQLRQGSPLDLAGPHPTATTLRTGQPVFLPALSDALIASLYQELVEHHPHLQLPAVFRESRLSSGLVVPLVARTGLIGAITCVTTGDRRLTPAHLELAEDLARRCALAIDNARLYREAREAISVRDEFLSVAAHELKTPLTSLRGYAQLLVRDLDHKGTVDPARGRRSATTIMLQADKLSRLIGQLLDVSRIQSGKLVVDRELVDLSRVVRDATETLRTGLRGRTLVNRLPAELPANVDPVRIEQVIVNLLDNALKYSPAGSQIDVELAAFDGHTARLVVRDYGQGITPEHRAHIFDRFYQGHRRGRLTDVAGMGLGLYISRQILELHGGSITAEFPPDGGTRFVVTVPR